MKKSLLRSLALCFVAVIPLAMSADYKPGYYDKMNGQKKEGLKKAAKECVYSHKMLVYSQLPEYWQYTDVYPELYGGLKRWWDMYSDGMYVIKKNQTAFSSFSSNRMQREHAIPKSWWKKNGDVEYTPAYSDMWNLYPSDGPANQAKLNYPVGECKSTTYDNGVTKVGPAKSGQGGGSGIVFEPGNEYKGDFARAYFYMATVYDDLPWVYNYVFQKDSYPSLRPWAIDLLLQWARMDPVSQKEIDRNDAVEYYQGNRNPFVDFPELAEYIWGMRTQETFFLSEQGGTVTPPLTGDPELTAPVSGETLDFGEAAIGQSVFAPLIIEGKNLTAPLSLIIGGKDKRMFTSSVTSIPAYEINGKNNYLLNIIYTPTSEGIHTATLMLYDGGLDASQNVSVELRGEGFPVPTLSTLRATEASNVSDNSYVANWEATSDIIDYYVVTRVRYTAEGQEVEELIANENHLEIDERDPNVTESYTVQSSRIGIRSQASNSIVVAAGAGIRGIQTAQPLTLGYMQGGFVVMLDEMQTNLTVTDMAGRIVEVLPDVSGGEMVYLPIGIYVVTTDQNPVPVKILVKD